MKLRWDKFLWCVRLAKTRSLASDLISKGKIKINGETIKPSREVKLNDLISVQKNTATFTFKAVGFTDKRVGAQLVSNFLVDLTPQEELEKLKLYQAAQRNYRQTDGKPTKKDRRELDDFLSNWGEDEGV
ncbi:MAG: RNA-binding S4 domain-containing protein [Bacteroidetes bacterium]|nr:RNA-binding S4 domain-containing protein [Bacteroidota bacterium]